jgi:hypothetical protein
MAHQKPIRNPPHPIASVSMFQKYEAIIASLMVYSIDLNISDDNALLCSIATIFENLPIKSFLIRLKGTISQGMEIGTAFFVN